MEHFTTAIKRFASVLLIFPKQDAVAVYITNFYALFSIISCRVYDVFF